MKKRHFIHAGLAALAAFPISAQAQTGDIKIGAVLSVTGPAGYLGDPELKTLQLYIERIISAGGVQGAERPCGAVHRQHRPRHRDRPHHPDRPWP